MVKPKLSPGFKSRKNKLALAIRVSFLVTVSFTYLLISVLNDGESESLDSEIDRSSYKRRNLLAILDVNETEPNITTTDVIEPSTEHERNCTPAAIYEFPPDGFTRDQRRRGWIVIHVMIACYCFWLLAIVCDDYFVPAIAMMCQKLEMREDVAGATFMAAASSSPELFINCVGTFVTEGDIGVGTVVGSAVFNILAVPACCGLFGGQVVELSWWPVTRDSMMYGVSVVGLIAVLYDGKVMWYEALVLVCAYAFYIAAMYCNESISRFMSKAIGRKSYIRPYTEVVEISPLLSKDMNGDTSLHSMENGINGKSNGHAMTGSNETEFATSPWSRRDANIMGYICRWPVTLFLWMTIPDCRRYPKLRMVTFFVCILWIGFTSYLVAFLITVVGDTIKIPDSVMGLTFLAAGTCVPEAVSSIIVTNQGHGAMGISNSIGSNTFDILLCLGLPWLIKSLAMPTVEGNPWVTLNSTGLTYSAVSLLSTLVGLYSAFWFNKFRLDWKVGVTCLVMYVAFLTLASLIELNVFFPVNVPTCDQ